VGKGRKEIVHEEDIMMHKEMRQVLKRIFLSAALAAILLPVPVKAGAAEKVSSEKMSRLFSTLGIQEIKKRKEAPGFTLFNLKGKKVSLKDYRGKVVLLNFMTTWCHWCRKEMPHLQKLYDRFKDRDFVIVSVFGDREGARVVGPFIKKSGYTFSVSSGLLDSTGRVAGIYRVTGTPTSYLIDRKGKIIGWEVGYREWFSKDARDLIEGLLGSE